LPRHARDTEAVGGFPLPDVEGSVGGGREIDGATCPLDPCRLLACRPLPWLGIHRLGDQSLGARLSEAGDAFGGRAISGRGPSGHLRAERSGAGSDVAGVEAHCGDVPPVGANQ
jgi:hypothetical protein